ncbi:uncharacterized protein BX664DRAFT_100513 [Halteromyces radiatus]|uniref:uncharacterized protein n=1 Tax=Halteromyces radiatus TaxID=101107 RepID=UPI00221EB0A3|nr:uncharacterized protein BX664DRAFT_100513 [Halteromyces radiatus]KAI8093099.1 hypothetical protein BX664DRAFT_100513 [Halteromyces radiatus]
MNWQIDNRSDHSTTVVRHNLQQDIDQNPTPLSNWFAQYRRKSTNKFNNSKRSSSVKDYDSLSSNVAQAKRPRVQLELPFDFERTSSSVSPSTVLPTTVAHTNSNNRILLAPSSLQSLSTDTTIGRFDETSMETSTTRQNTDIFGSPSNSSNRRRDIAALFAKSLSSPSSSAQNLQIDTGLSHTLNEIITFDLASSSMEDIRKNYSFHRERHTQFHRRSIAEYCQQTTSAIDQQEPTLQSLYLENKMKIIFCAQRVRTDLGWVMKKLEAIDMTQ